MTDIKTQWQNAIVSKELGIRESVASYYTFKIWCRNPEWTLKELATNTGRKYDKIKEWSKKYFYQSRKQAYIQHIHEELEEQELIIKKRLLDSMIQKQQTDNEILQDDQDKIRTLQRILQPETIDKDQVNIYTTFKDSYFKNCKDNTQTIQTGLRTVNEGVNADDYDKQELSPAAQRMVEILEQIRDEEQ